MRKTPLGCTQWPIGSSNQNLGQWHGERPLDRFADRENSWLAAGTPRAAASGLFISRSSTRILMNEQRSTIGFLKLCI
jgi:hypothetical protein